MCLSRDEIRELGMLCRIEAMRHEQRMMKCQGKAKHANRGDAMRGAFTDQECYRCEFCGAWHVGDSKLYLRRRGA